MYSLRCRLAPFCSIEMLTRPCQVQFIQKQLDFQVLEMFLHSYVWIYQAFNGKTTRKVWIVIKEVHNTWRKLAFLGLDIFRPSNNRLCYIFYLFIYLFVCV